MEESRKYRGFFLLQQNRLCHPKYPAKVVRYRILVFGRDSARGRGFKRKLNSKAYKVRMKMAVLVDSKSFILIMTTPTGISTLLATATQSHRSGVRTIFSDYAG
jgi:hypothetical protein